MGKIQSVSPVVAAIVVIVVVVVAGTLLWRASGGKRGAQVMDSKVMMEAMQKARGPRGIMGASAPVGAPGVAAGPYGGR